MVARYILTCILSLVMAVAVQSAQTNGHSQATTTDCKQCHTCDNPTASAPCLKVCPRSRDVHKTSKHGLSEAPDSMVLGQIASLYQPVHFNHKLHAGMAEMGSDCSTCHHFSPAGQIPPCRECHSAAGESTDLSKPNLKGAYHRQCLGCHREWSHDTKCVVCHLPKEGGALAAQTDPTDIVGISHPMVTVPPKKLYDTPYKPGPMVTFQHKEHIDLFDLQCVNCHAKENCGNCHDLQKTARKVRTQEEVHAICNDCHSKDACAKCHDTKQRPGFNHSHTGWALNRFHRPLDCRACHPTGKRIAKLNNSCGNCHGGWNQDNFKHAIVGLRLDETHGTFDCTDCHANRAYDKAPTCDGCHDDGRTATSAPPGTRVSHS